MSNCKGKNVLEWVMKKRSKVRRGAEELQLCVCVIRLHDTQRNIRGLLMKGKCVYFIHVNRSASISHDSCATLVNCNMFMVVQSYTDSLTK